MTGHPGAVYTRRSGLQGRVTPTTTWRSGARSSRLFPRHSMGQIVNAPMSSAAIFEMPVSDRDTLDGLTQFAFFVLRRDRKLLILKTERCPSG